MGVVEDARTATAIVAIQQLAVTYAYAVDSRDLDLLVSLYIEDVDRGGAGVGRGALRASLQRMLSRVGPSIHIVTNHVVTLAGEEHGRGIVYHRGERQDLDGTWSTRVGAYDDEYRRRDGEWFFARRTLRYWYRDGPVPAPPTVRATEPMAEGSVISGETLPGAWASWGRFWAEVESTQRSP